MRRLTAVSAAVLLCLVIAAGASAAGDGGAGGGPAPKAGAAKKCGKKKHFRSKAAKRRYRRRCMGPGAGTGTGSAPGGDQEAPCPFTASSPGAIGAQEDEFTLVLTRAMIECGVIRVNQQNLGEDPHDLAIRKAGGASIAEYFPELAPGTPGNPTSLTKNVVLTRGTWNFYCTLPNHAALGMERNLTVK